MYTAHPLTVGQLKVLPFYQDPNLYWMGTILSFGAAATARCLSWSGWTKSSERLNSLSSVSFVLFMFAFLALNGAISIGVIS